MSEVRLVKISTGDFVIGVDDKDNNCIKEAALVQIVPTGTGDLSIALLPLGFPFEEDIKGNLKTNHIIYEVSSIPEELKNKYTEAKSNIKIAKASSDGKIIL